MHNAYEIMKLEFVLLRHHVCDLYIYHYATGGHCSEVAEIRADEYVTIMLQLETEEPCRLHSITQTLNLVPFKN